MGRYRTDFMIHIDETLDVNKLQDMQKDICFEEGIYNACVSSADHHTL